MYEHAFENCSNLNEIIFEGQEDPVFYGSFVIGCPKLTNISVLKEYKKYDFGDYPVYIYYDYGNCGKYVICRFNNTQFKGDFIVSGRYDTTGYISNIDTP